MMTPQVLGAYILAGGKSSRFGSDKARALVKGEPLLLRLVHQLKAVTGLNVTLMVNEAERYADFGFESVTDLQPELGPIGGLQSALEHAVQRSESGWLLIVPCDLLDYDKDWHQRLLDQLAAAHNNTLAIAFLNQDWLPFPALYHTDILPAVDDSIQRQLLSPRRLLANLDRAVIGVSTIGLRKFRSVNTREELELYLKDREDLL